MLKFSSSMNHCQMENSQSKSFLIVPNDNYFSDAAMPKVIMIMASYSKSSRALSSLFLFFLPFHIIAQSPPNSANDSSCPLDKSSCDTLVAYFARSPDFLEVGNVSDLFQVNRSAIAKANNLESEDALLFPGQLLLVPVTCSCNGGHYFAKITYKIKGGDIYYALSVTTFENLTDWHIVNALNPKFKPNLLLTGDEVIFPLFCKCPTKADMENHIKYLITYIWQPMDDVSTVSVRFNASSKEILSENEYQDMKTAVNLPVFIPVSHLPVLSQTNPFQEMKNEKPKKWIFAVLISLGGFVLITLLATGFVYTYYKKKKPLKWKSSSLETAGLMEMNSPKNNSPKVAMNLQNKLLPKVSDYLHKPILYDIKVIMEATKNFKECSRIEGSVYRATVNGKTLAVKRSKEDTTEELRILQKVNHVNLVKLTGFSFDINQSCFLVYEYAENGSLEKRLSSSPLTWNQRLSIALDIANGLQYLHEHIQPSIVHRDIRTSNILLDSKLKAKIANLSMAKPAMSSVSHKVDVFAFGVVVLELLSGRKAMEVKGNGEVVMLWKEIREVLEVEEEKEERLKRWMDPKLEGLEAIDGALSIAEMGSACTHEMPLGRPSMGEIVFNLSLLIHSSSLISLEDSTEVGQKIGQVTAR